LRAGEEVSGARRGEPRCSGKTATARRLRRASLYDDITGKIIAELEAGRSPGSSHGDRRGQGAARHAEERRNRAALFGDQRADPLGRRDPARLSRPELAHLPPGPVAGRQCPRGERGTTVVYADRFTPEDEKRRARETGEDAAAIPFLKRFTVFNAAQCDGLPEDVAIVAPPPPPGLIEPRSRP
jgi:hypothetical protein